MFLEDPNAPDTTEITPGQRRGIIGFALFFYGCLVADLFVDYSPVKLGAVFFIAAYPPLVALHEFGHALMARGVGWQIEEIVVGFGRTLKRWQWQGARVELRTVPLGGHMLPVPPADGGGRLASFLVYAGGPGIELLLVGVCVLVFGYDTLTTRTDHLGLIAVQATCLAALTGVAINLIPLQTSSGAVTDGLGMVLSLFRSRAMRDRIAAATQIEAGAEQLRQDDFAGALETFGQALESHPDVAAVHIGYAEALIGLGRRGEALMGLSSVARDPGRSSGFRKEIERALVALRAR